MTLEQYLDEFLNWREVVEECGGSVGVHPGLIDIALEEAGFDLDDPNSISAKERKKPRGIQKKHTWHIFLSNTNKIKFAPLLRDLANAHLHRKDEYLRTIATAHKLLVGWEGGSYVITGPANDGIAYTTLTEENEEEVIDEEGNMLVNTCSGGKKVLCTKQGNIIKCYLCGGNHYVVSRNRK
eukprot:4046561-Ditylum_brightwellii.AAC.1